MEATRTPSGRFLLLGSGEFESWVGPIERDLLSRATGDGSRAVERAVGQYRPTRGWAQQEVTGEDEDSSRSGESDQVRDMLSVVISFPERLCGHR